MKLCLGVGAALLLFGCGGGEGDIPFQDPREPESAGRVAERPRDSRDSSVQGGTQQPGGNGPPSDLLESCSGTYTCGGASATLSSSAGACQLVVGDTLLTLEAGGTVTFMDAAVGTWTGNSQSFQVCFEGECTSCTAL